MQGEGQARKQLQVTPVRRADDGKQDVNRLAIQRPEIDRLREESERDRRPGHVQDDGVADVGDGDAVADGGRSRSFPREEKTQEKLPVHVLGQRQDLHQGTKGPVLARVLEFVVNAADLQSLGQAWDGFGVRFEVIEQLQRNPDVVRRRPFQQLGSIDAVLSADLLGR